jgi:hypothetical protein
MENSNGAVSFNTSVPNAARIYDYWLGGKDNFAADREAAWGLARAVPQLPWLSRENRRFLGRAVRFCASAGITQVLDIGSGLPTAENVHEVAEQVAANPRVVYVDNDPVAVGHGRALLSTPRTAAVHGDLTRPDEILQDRDVRRLIDFGQPVAVLLVALLHIVPDEAGAYVAVARLRDAMAPGSFLVISHTVLAPGCTSGRQSLRETGRGLGEARKAMARATARTRDQVAAFFGGMTLVEPGLTDVSSWRPETGPVMIASDVMTLLGGVARKD